MTGAIRFRCDGYRQRVAPGARARVLMMGEYDTLVGFVFAQFFPRKMALTLADVARIAHLARIEITPAEATDVKRKLELIFEMIGELRAVDTTDITPMSHAQDLMLPLRPDVVAETDEHLVYQQNAPATEGGLYLVPKVIE